MKNKELVILDLDGVIVKGQSQKYFLDFLLKKRLLSPFSYFKIYLWFWFYKLGFVKNPKKIMKYAFKFLKDKKVVEIQKIIDDFFENKLKKFISDEMIDIIEEHKNKNRELIIVSNSIDIIVKKLAIFLKIKNFIATKLEIIDNKFTGNILNDIIYGSNKVKHVKDFIKKNKLNITNSWGYADHISDLSLLLFVRNKFAVNPDKFLLKEAKKRNWNILNLR